jgi:hypothetical protein
VHSGNLVYGKLRSNERRVRERKGTYKEATFMRLSKLFKSGAVIAVMAGIIIAASACSGGNTAKVLSVNSDTVLGAAGLANPADACVISSRYQQGQSVVFRIKVFDPATGSFMDDKALKTVVVTLKDGQTFSARYGGHPGGQGSTPTDFFWSTAWAIPADYPTGSVSYTVTATSNDGRTGQFAEFNVAPSLLTVIAAQ